MRICSEVIEQELINIRNIAEQQKTQRALKIKKRLLKQTHENKLADNLSQITKKLDEVNESTRKTGDVKKESNSENESTQELVLVEINSIQSTIKSLTKASNF